MLLLIILVLGLIASFIAPWWAILIIAFIAAFYLGKKSTQAFWLGFMGVFLVWMILILLKTGTNNYFLPNRVAILFHLPGWATLILITTSIGGLTGGVSALSGFLVKKAFFN